MLLLTVPAASTESVLPSELALPIVLAPTVLAPHIGLLRPTVSAPPVDLVSTHDQLQLYIGPLSPTVSAPHTGPLPPTVSAPHTDPLGEVRAWMTKLIKSSPKGTI